MCGERGFFYTPKARREVEDPQGEPPPTPPWLPTWHRGKAGGIVKKNNDMPLVTSCERPAPRSVSGSRGTWADSSLGPPPRGLGTGGRVHGPRARRRAPCCPGRGQHGVVGRQGSAFSPRPAPPLFAPPQQGTWSWAGRLARAACSPWPWRGPCRSGASWNSAAPASAPSTSWRITATRAPPRASGPEPSVPCTPSYSINPLNEPCGCCLCGVGIEVSAGGLAR